MPEYIAKRDTWLSHENREVKAGTKFTTEFPKANGKPMRLGENLVLAKDATAEDKIPADNDEQGNADQA